MPAKRQPASDSPLVTPHTVKLCELCGTLNFEHNKECWTCRWAGAFRRDPDTIELAWQRLESQYEEVRLEHVTAARRRPALGDFGAARPAAPSRRFLQSLFAGWQRFQSARDRRMAERRARLSSRRFPSRRSSQPMPPDGLGV